MISTDPTKQREIFEALQLDIERCALEDFFGEAVLTDLFFEHGQWWVHIDTHEHLFQYAVVTGADDDTIEFELLDMTEIR